MKRRSTHNDMKIVGNILVFCRNKEAMLNYGGQLSRPRRLHFNFTQNLNLYKFRIISFASGKKAFMFHSKGLLYLLLTHMLNCKYCKVFIFNMREIKRQFFKKKKTWRNAGLSLLMYAHSIKKGPSLRF